MNYGVDFAETDEGLCTTTGHRHRAFMALHTAFTKLALSTGDIEPQVEQCAAKTMCFDMLPVELVNLIVQHVDSGCALLFSRVNKTLFLLVSRHFTHLPTLSEAANAKVDEILRALDYMIVNIGCEKFTVKHIREFLTFPFQMNDRLLYYLTEDVVSGRGHIDGMPSFIFQDRIFFSVIAPDGDYDFKGEEKCHRWFRKIKLHELDYVFFQFFCQGGWGVVVVNNRQGCIELVPSQRGSGIEYANHTIRFMKANYLKVCGEACKHTWNIKTVLRNEEDMGDGALVICTIDRRSSGLPGPHTTADMALYRRHLISRLTLIRSSWRLAPEKQDQMARTRLRVFPFPRPK